MQDALNDSCLEFDRICFVSQLTRETNSKLAVPGLHSFNSPSECVERLRDQDHFRLFRNDGEGGMIYEQTLVTLLRPERPTS